MGVYRLPELNYDYGALEPAISGKTLELHHRKHHATYVKMANETLEKIADARGKGAFAELPALEHAMAFHHAGHVLHSIFWRNLSPRGGGPPRGELALRIERDLGGFDAFKQQLDASAAGLMGSGWAALLWEPLAGRLMVTQIFDHQANLGPSNVPLLVVDAWEHAYYLDYQNRKTEFFAALWERFDWDDVAKRLTAAQATRLEL